MQGGELMSQDHVTLQRGLDILDGMVKRLEDGERIEIADVTATLKFLNVFFREHSEERAIVAEIEAALNNKKGIAFVNSSRRLSVLLRVHVEAERPLSKKEDEMAGAEFINFTRLENKYMRKPQRTPVNSVREVARGHGAGSYV